MQPSRGTTLATMTGAFDIRRAADRPVSTASWLTSRHSFSFGDHYDPANTHHGVLMVNNDETVAPGGPLRIYHPLQTYKNKMLSDFTVRELMVPVFKDGVQVYDPPRVPEIQAYAKKEMSSLWDEYKRPMNPHIYKVDLTDKLYDLKKRLINEHVEGQK